MATTGHVTRRPITVFENGVVNRRLKLTELCATRYPNRYQSDYSHLDHQRGRQKLVASLRCALLSAGCHMTHPGGLSTYHCEGGRSFTVDTTLTLPGGHASGHATASGGSSVGRPSAWYIAASNCAALNGLDLRYRLVVYGHVGDCPTPDEPSSQPGQSVRSSQLVQHDEGTSGGQVTVGDDGTASCVVRGRINSTSRWHGFVTEKPLQKQKNRRKKLLKTKTDILSALV